MKYKVYKYISSTHIGNYLMDANLEYICDLKNFDYDMDTTSLILPKDEMLYVVEFDNNNNYIKAIGTIFTYDDEISIDCAEHDNKVLCDVAFAEKINKEWYWKRLKQTIESCDLLDKVIEFVNNEII